MPQEQFERLVGRVLTGVVAVEDEHDLVGKASQRRDVIVSQCCSEGANHVAKSHLMRGDHVGIAFDHRHPARLSGGRPGEVAGVDQPAFLEERRLWAVEIFCDTFARRGEDLFHFGQDPPSEPDGPALRIMDWKHQPASKPFPDNARGVRGPRDEPGFLQQIDRKPLLLGPSRQPAAFSRSISQLESRQARC